MNLNNLPNDLDLLGLLGHCGDYTYDQTLNLTTETSIRIDLCEACVNQTTWHCLTHLHLHTYFWSFNMGMALLSLFSFFGLCALFFYVQVIHASSPDPR